jgi:hypothetical protein
MDYYDKLYYCLYHIYDISIMMFKKYYLNFIVKKFLNIKDDDSQFYYYNNLYLIVNYFISNYFIINYIINIYIIYMIKLI